MIGSTVPTSSQMKNELPLARPITPVAIPKLSATIT